MKNQIANSPKDLAEMVDIVSFEYRWFENILASLKKNIVFRGRSTRREYWFSSAINAIFILGFVVGFQDSFSVGQLVVICVLGMSVPILAVTVRRLHDTNHSGWWVLISLVPVIGQIMFISLMVFDGDKEENEYGPI
jgi:uncharacterized membrane protein YhaH (DUF805 family)